MRLTQKTRLEQIQNYSAVEKIVQCTVFLRKTALKPIDSLHANSEFAIRTARAVWLAVLALALAWMAPAQGVSTTTVQGTVYLANGQPGSGTLQVSWPAFTTSNGLAVAAGRLAATIGADGFASVNLTPNVGATPAGLYYTVVYQMSDGTTSTEYWVVPAAAQATIAAVRAQVMPAAQAVQAASKTYVDQAIESLASGSLTPVGGTLAGPLYLNGDPTQSLQAADKHYVDTAFAQAMPLAGGAATGPLTATRLGTAWQVDQFAGVDFGAKLQACINGLNAVYGGTCDARNFTGTLAMGSSVTIATANTTVLLPCATIATAQQILVTAGTRNVSLRGCSLRGASAASATAGGTVFLYSGAGAMIQVGDPAYATDTSGFHLDNVAINTTTATAATAQALAAYRTQEMDLQSVSLTGNANQTGMTLDGTGNATGGTFYDITADGFKTAINGVGHQTANAATTDWLNASTFVRVRLNCPTSNGAPVMGTVGINLAQGDGNTFTGGDVEGCATALHLGANAQNNTIVGLRNGNSTNQIVADAGSAYNNWIAGGAMFTGKLVDNGTRNSFLDAFHRSFNGIDGDWYGSQQDATVTNRFQLGTGQGNERGLLDRYQTDYGTRWTMGLTDATAGEQFYEVRDELNNVNRLAVGQYLTTAANTVTNVTLNDGGCYSSSTAPALTFTGGGGSGAAATANMVASSCSGGYSVGSVTMTNNGSGYTSQPTIAWSGTNQVSAPGAVAEIATAGGTNNPTAVNAAGTGAVVLNGANNAGTGGVVIGSGGANATTVATISNAGNANFAGTLRVGNSQYAAFTASNAIQFPGLAATSGYNCLQIDNSGYISNTGSACGAGGGGSGTVNAGATGQIAYYGANGAAISGISTVPVASGGTGASTAAGALTSLGAASLASTSAQAFTGEIDSPAVTASVNQQLNVMAAPYNAKGDCSTDDHDAIQAAIDDAYNHFYYLATIFFPNPPGGCYKTSTLTWNGASLEGPSAGLSGAVGEGTQVYLQGMPGEDILHVPDPTANTLIWQQGWTIKNITFVVDDSAAGSFPHRWPGRWFDDAAMTAGSATLASTHGMITCADIGQAIQVNGAGAGGANLVTTIQGVTPCWTHPDDTGWKIVTLATAASTTVTNAHTYVSVAALPVTANIGACGLAFDDEQGNTADWSNPSQSLMNYGDFLYNVTFRSTSGTDGGKNNSCGIYTQGVWGAYALDAQNFMFTRLTYGVVQGSSELNSFYANSASDFQKWNHGTFNGTYYPWISYDGLSGTMEDVQLATEVGPQFLELANQYGDTFGNWKINVPSFENDASGYGFTLVGQNIQITNTALNAGTATARVFTQSSTCSGCDVAGTLNLGGSGNKLDLFRLVDRSQIVDTGFGNSVTGHYQGMLYKDMPSALKTTLNAYKGDGVGGELTADYADAGSLPSANDLWIWPQDAKVDSYGGAAPYSSYIQADSTSPTGYEFLMLTNAFSQFSQFAGVGPFANGSGNIVVGTQIPASGIVVSFLAKCPSGTTSFSFWLAFTSGAKGDQIYNCSTNWQVYTDTVSGLTSGDVLTLGKGSFQTSPYYVAWFKIRPFQANYNGYQPAQSGANSDITSLTGLTTPLGTAQGGTGAGALTGYRYANGSSADTASTTIPKSAVGGQAGTGAGLVTGPVTSVSGDVVTYTGTAGQVQDSGVALSNLAPLASPSFTGTAAAAAWKATTHAGTGTMTLTTGAAAGTSPSIACATSHVCDGVSGMAKLTTGTSPTTGTLATLTFPSAHTNYANCVVNVASGTAQVTTVTWSETATAVTLTANAALTASTAYQVRYWCGGN